MMVVQSSVPQNPAPGDGADRQPAPEPLSVHGSGASQSMQQQHHGILPMDTDTESGKLDLTYA